MTRNQTNKSCKTQDKKKWDDVITSEVVTPDNVNSLEEFMDCYDMHETKLLLLHVFIDSKYDLEGYAGGNEAQCIFGMLKFLEEIDNRKRA